MDAELHLATKVVGPMHFARDLPSPRIEVPSLERRGAFRHAGDSEKLAVQYVVRSVLLARAKLAIYRRPTLYK